MRDAATGAQACEIVGREGGGIDVILMNIQMPGMDGAEVAALIRADRRLAELPLVLLSSINVATTGSGGGGCVLALLDPEKADFQFGALKDKLGPTQVTAVEVPT